MGVFLFYMQQHMLFGQIKFLKPVLGYLLYKEKLIMQIMH